MVELPETYVLADQINKTLKGKTIVNVTTNASPHAFAAFTGNPADYRDKLSGRKITGSNPGTGYTCGGNTEVLCEDMLLVITTPIKYHPANSKLPLKHQLLLEFDDSSHLSCTVQMWGGMYCFSIEKGEVPSSYKKHIKPMPLEDDFNEEYFNELLDSVKKNISVKAFLATEQRIPGLGNGVLQDILFNARIHPKTKLENLSKEQLLVLYKSVKSTLLEMKNGGGRDTEKNLYGMSGGYVTILSAKTVKHPCIKCGREIVREAYLGGNIYYCPVCQKYEK